MKLLNSISLQHALVTLRKAFAGIHPRRITLLSSEVRLNIILKDVRFWIVLFFIIRLYGITLPPLELSHSWRQTDGLMIARNFYETSANIFYPRIDSAGEKPGIVGSEFPLLNFLIYLVSQVFGYDHWYGRIIVLICSSLGSFAFYKVVRRYFGEAAGFNATLLLLASLWFSFSRKIIPDTFAVSFCFGSLYYASRYLDSGRGRSLLLFFFLGLLGCLSKIIAATTLTVLLIPMLDSRYALLKKLNLTFFSGIIFSAVYGWYFIWVPHLNTTYGSAGHFFMGMSFAEGIQDIIYNSLMVLRRLYVDPMKYSGCILFIASIFLICFKRKWQVLATFLIPYIAFLILLVRTGANVIGDEYYILTMIPSMAFIMGCALDSIKNKRLIIALLIIVASEGIGDQVYDFRIRQPFKSLADLEVIMNSVSARNDLVAVNGEYDNPTFMYFAHRRGWVVPNSYLLDSNYLDSIISKGCKYVVVAKKLYGELDLAYPVVHDSEYFRIYKTK